MFFEPLLHLPPLLILLEPLVLHCFFQGDLVFLAEDRLNGVGGDLLEAVGHPQVVRDGEDVVPSFEVVEVEKSQLSWV